MFLSTQGGVHIQIESNPPGGGRADTLAFLLLLQTDSIENTSATQTWQNTYNICQVSGFRAKPGQLVRRWDGLMVLPQYSEPRHPQDFVRAKAERLTGSIRPEPAADKFLKNGEVTADDL